MLYGFFRWLQFTSGLVLAVILFSLPAHAQSEEDFLGLWMTPEKDALLRMRMCKRQAFMSKATSLCGQIVWDDTMEDCWRKIAQFDEFKNGSWQDGWVFNVYDKRSYNARIFIRPDGTPVARLFVGKETQSQDMVFTRVNAYPADCKGKRAKAILIK